ncbi:hypothetical protein Patl1_27563 [Pistacia atlantica]|uniref:Uncharacterized protein n=1 Tax=Pistacia atlantica TaxID=434234 RepID=A0ACC1BCL0_9ROSI|nr:hypothetical protein Patl1_27563 [Pistacia atlantica]
MYCYEEFEAVVCDFGLAKLMDYNDTHVTTAVRGTIGHIAPEYLSTGKSSEKNDAFAYGVMLLELVTRQRAFDLAKLANDDDVMLLDCDYMHFIHDLLTDANSTFIENRDLRWDSWHISVRGLVRENKLDMLVDPDLEDNYIEIEVEQLTQLPLICAQTSPKKRPKMSEVVRMLEGDGLAGRWEEWQKGEAFRHDLKLAPPLNSDWIVDSTDKLHAFELSGPG